MRLLVSASLVSLLAMSASPILLPGAGPATSTTLAWQFSHPANAIIGTVTDGRDAGRRGVTVELLRDGHVVETTTTDVRGGFRFGNLTPGVYEVRARVSGFAPASLRVAVSDLPGPPLRLALGIPVPVREYERSARAGKGVSVRLEGGVQGGVPGGVVGGVVGGLPAGPPVASAPVRVGGNIAPAYRQPSGEFDTATYDRIEDNRFRQAVNEPVSTFSIDADTASYANVRRFLNRGALPPADAVRIEELVNYFRFDYPDPAGDAPFSVTAEVAACPWNPRHRLALIGLQATRDGSRGRAEVPPSPKSRQTAALDGSGQLGQENAPARNLVFLLDVSGSMQPVNKLPLVRTAMRMLVDTLTAQDRVAIVVYAGASGLVLPSTPGDRKAEIHDAIGRLEAGGSTNGAAGIRLAYDTAASTIVEGGVNRVILATDGDFNVGMTSQGELVRLIEKERERGIFLSVLGVGDDNLKDSTMEKLADEGNGNYAYLDSLDEAYRVLVAEAGATLAAVAKDVKIQVEFNPRTVGAYRLIGYENRLLNREDFNDDRKDAGEVGAGKAVTALYELIPPGEPIEGDSVDPLKYQEAPVPNAAAGSGELMTVKLRYKAPDGDTSRLLTLAVKDDPGEPTTRLGFAAAVAQFGMLLRDSEFKGDASWSSARALARTHRGDDPDGYRAEFVRLVDLAAALESQKTTPQETRR